MRYTKPIAIAAVLALLVAGAGLAAAVTGPAAPAQLDQSSPGESIQVSDSGSASATPDQVRIRLAVVATADDAPTARSRLAANVSQMRQALLDAGLSDSQIQTTRYDLRQDRVRPPRPDAEQPELQYRGEHSFAITVSDLDATGEVIDTAVANGANSIDDVQFTLSEDQRRQLERQALEAAVQNARQKAATLADASDLRVTGVHRVASQMNRYIPVAADGGDGGAAATSIDNGPVSVTVSVDVSFNATQA